MKYIFIFEKTKEHNLNELFFIIKTNNFEINNKYYLSFINNNIHYIDKFLNSKLKYLKCIFTDEDIKISKDTFSFVEFNSKVEANKYIKKCKQIQFLA